MPIVRAQKDRRYNADNPERATSDPHRLALWQKVRASYIAAHPLCASCLKQGKEKFADVVDHIIPLPQGELLDESNLQSFCHACHNAKTRLQRTLPIERAVKIA